MQVGRITQLTAVLPEDIPRCYFDDRFEFDADSMRWWYKFPCLACVHRNVTVTAHCLACTHYPTTFTAEYKPTRGSTQ